MDATQSDIETFLAERKKPFTMGDLMSLTGRAGHELQPGIEAAMKTFRCGLQATEEGDLLYDFGAKLERRNEIRWADRARSASAWFWKWFSIAYKASLAIVLSLYFVFFVVVLVAMVVAVLAASASADAEDSGGDAASGAFSIVGRMFLSIFEIWTFTPTIYHPLDRHGYPYRHFDPRKSSWPSRKSKRAHRNKSQGSLSEKDKHNKKKSFIASVYDFALGPPRVETDPFANQKELAAFVREKKGVATTTDVQALAGMDTKRASEFLTSAIVDFDGTAEITENGVFYGRFDNLIRGTEREESLPIVYVWNEYSPEHELTGNTGGRNALIIFMNGFNLLLSYLLMTGSLASNLVFSETTMFWVSSFPFAFSISLFALPLLRWGWVKRRQSRQHLENIRRRLLRVLFSNHEKSFTIDSLLGEANALRSTEEVLSPSDVKNVVEELVYDLGGDSSVTEGITKDAAVVYRFDRIHNEIIEIEEVRQHLLPTTSAGAVVPLLT